MKTLLIYVACSLTSISAFAQIPTNGLVGRFEFTKNFIDSSGQNNHGNNYGSSFRNDRCFVDSTAINFNGNDDYVNIGKMESFASQLNSFAISLWFKSTQPKSTYETITKVLNSSGNGTAFSVELNRGSGSSFQEGNINLYLRDRDGRALSVVIYDMQINNCAWHHLVWSVSNSAANSFKLYLDGAERTPLSGYARQSPYNFSGFQYDLLLGAANNRGEVERNFNGALDDVYFYSRNLTAKEVETLHRAKCSQPTHMDYGKSTHLIYPNPTTDFVNIKSNNDCFEYASIELVSFVGQILQVSEYDWHVKLDIRGYARALYLIRLRNKNGDIVFSKKVILN